MDFDPAALNELRDLFAGANCLWARPSHDNDYVCGSFFLFDKDIFPGTFISPSKGTGTKICDELSAGRADRR
jgi:hypothetical protein